MVLHFFFERYAGGLRYVQVKPFGIAANISFLNTRSWVCVCVYVELLE